MGERTSLSCGVLSLDQERAGLWSVRHLRGSCLFSFSPLDMGDEGKCLHP